MGTGKTVALGFVVFAFLLEQPYAGARDYPKEGRFDNLECFVGSGPRVENGSGAVFGSQILHSAATATKPGASPLDGYGGYCLVVYVEDPKGKSMANGYCEQTDVDGDKWVSSFVDEGNTMSGKFVSIQGTGKYVGARIQSEFNPAGPLYFGSPGHVQRCLRVTGTYQLR